MTDQLQVIVNRALANLHHTQESKRDIITRACEEWGALAVNAATDFWHRQNGEQRKELHELRQRVKELEARLER
jgi:hypothetical protein